MDEAGIHTREDCARPWMEALNDGSFKTDLVGTCGKPPR